MLYYTGRIVKITGETRPWVRRLQPIAQHLDLPHAQSVGHRCSIRFRRVVRHAGRASNLSLAARAGGAASRSCLSSSFLTMMVRARSKSSILLGLLTLVFLLGALICLPAYGGPSYGSWLIPPGAEATGLQVGAGPPITGRTAMVLDADTGKVLLDRQGDLRVAPASLTKIMTTLIAIERGQLSDVVKVSVDSQQLARTTGSSIMGLMPGEEIKLEDLLYGMMLPSGNDASLAVAEHISGSVDAFVALMNLRAAELGLKNTHFANPHGLDASGHYSSARDMVLLSRYAMGNATFARIAGARSYTAQGKQRSYSLWNLNRLIGQYPGADGVKIGYTDDAGQTIVGSATRGGRRLYVAVMGCTAMYSDASALLDYYFQSLPPGQTQSSVTSTPSATPAGPSITPIPPSATPTVLTATPSPSPSPVPSSPTPVPPSATPVLPTAVPTLVPSTPTQVRVELEMEPPQPTSTPSPSATPTSPAVETASPSPLAPEVLSPPPATETPIIVVRRAENPSEARVDTGFLGVFSRAWEAVGSMLGRLIGR